MVILHLKVSMKSGDLLVSKPITATFNKHNIWKTLKTKKQKTPPLLRKFPFSAFPLYWSSSHLVHLLYWIKQATPMFTSQISMTSVVFGVVYCQLYGIYLEPLFLLLLTGSKTETCLPSAWKCSSTACSWMLTWSVLSCLYFFFNHISNKALMMGGWSSFCMNIVLNYLFFPFHPPKQTL